jgi:glycosyltransferase involved in cell wall biosynthesis
MRILMIIFNQTGKGTYQRASNFCRTLARRGHEVTLMVTSPREHWHVRDKMMDGVRLVEMPDWLSGSLRSGWDVWNTWQRVCWVRRQPPFHIVHAVESRPTVFCPMMMARRRGAKLVRDWSDWFGRGGSVEERRNPLVRNLVRIADTFFEEHFRRYGDATVTIVPFLRDRAIALGVPPESITVIPNGCDTHLPLIDLAKARRAVGLPADVPLLGYVGGIYPSDAEFMAAAFNQMLQARPDACLMLVGYFNRQIEPLINRPSQVLRSGWVNNEQMLQYLSACDVCWLPLRDSGANRGRWPGKLNDYMSIGRPVVSTAIGNLPDVIGRYAIGFTAPDDPAEFALQTLRLLNDAALRSEFGRNARQAAENDFNWNHMTDQLEQLYRDMINMREEVR